MTPIDFIGRNKIIGKNQPQYNQLPANIDSDGVITTCWELTEEERGIFLTTGKIYIQQHTFNYSMQPILPSVHNPIPSPTNN